MGQPAPLRVVEGKKGLSGGYGWTHWTGKPLSDDHELALVPQSIADGWEGYCSCGEWRAFQSMWYLNREETIARIRGGHKEHAASSTTAS